MNGDWDHIRSLEREIEHLHERMKREREAFSLKIETITRHNDAMLKAIVDGTAFLPPPPLYFCAKCAKELPIFKKEESR